MILVTSDLHLSDNPRDNYRFKFLDWLLITIKQQKIDFLLILGDITQEKDNHGHWLVNQWSDYIKKLANLCDVIILTGNHDYTSEGNPFFQFFRHIKGVSWIHVPTFKVVDGYNCWFLPHTNNYKKEWDIDFEKDDFVFAHQTFEGADIGTRKLEGIPLSVFPKGVRIISGDIHVPQTIGNLTYVGAPYTVNFGDDYEGRVLLIDSNGKVKSLRYEGPQKRLVEINSMNDLIRASEVDTDLHKGDLLKFRINVKQKDYEKWEDMRSAIRKWGDEYGFVVEVVQPVMEMKPRLMAKSASIKDDAGIVKAFGKRVEATKETLEAGLKMIQTE